MTPPGRSGTAAWLTLVVAVLCTGITGALSAAMIPDFEANYRIKRAGLTLGSTRLSFQVSAGGHAVIFSAQRADDRNLRVSREARFIVPSR